MKIRLKLTLLFLVTGALVMLASFSMIYYLSSNFRTLSAQNRMENRARTYARLLLDEKIVDNNTLHLIDKFTTKALKDEEIRIFDSAQKLVFYNNLSDTTVVMSDLLSKIRQKQKHVFSLKGKEGVGIIYHSQQGTYYILSMAFDDYGKNWMNNLARVLLISFVLGLFLLFVAGYFFAGQALAPITSIVDQVNHINVAKLDSRLNVPNVRDEIGELTRTFNNMLGRIENAFETQKNFVSSASHELRTPLTNITSEIEVSLIRQRSLEEYVATLNSLLVDIKKLNKLVNGLLDLMHAGADISTLRITQIRIDELLFFCRSALIVQNVNYQIKMEFTVMPDEENKLVIQGNENLLQAVFINILDNACKFSDDHKAGVVIGLDQDHVRITVRDNGIGIPAEEMTNIWKPFFRAENARSYNGHGIGLHLSKKIVELHKGSLSIDSAKNIGTTVTVRLPYHLSADSLRLKDAT